MRQILLLTRRLARSAGYAGTALSVLLLVALGVAPHTGAYRPVTVLTASMQPTIPAGSVVFVTPVDPGEVRVGDVLTYNIPVEDRRVVTHRVVEILEPGPAPVIRTQGDANPAPDAWSAHLTQGPVWRVRASLPALGSVLQALRDSRLHQAGVVALPALFALSLLSRIWGTGARRPPAGAGEHPSAGGLTSR